MRKKILLRFGDLMLKGKNRQIFVRQIRKLINEKLSHLDVEMNHLHDRTILSVLETDLTIVLKSIKYISGLSSYSIVYETTLLLEDIIKLSNEIIAQEINRPCTFKVETKRRNKRFPLLSLEVTQKVAPEILKVHHELLTVDVHNPQETLNIEIGENNALIYLKTHKGIGGFPVGIGGSALVLFSGGIDSPVASFLMMKQGIELELFHFESTPLTPLESVQKTIDLGKKLSNYMPNSKINLHLVPFTKIHEEILNHVNDSYIITIMRRIMFEMAEIFANQNGLLALVTGESVGQVASQTLESLRVVENVTNMPVLRPLITYDKNDIIKIAREIETYEISIRPFNDCCSIYVPKSPVIKPKISEAIRNQSRFDFSRLIEESLNGIQTIKLTPHCDLEIHQHGFTVEEALESIRVTK